jgi:MFS family permease
MLADRVSRTRTLSFAIVVWGAAMFWSAIARSFGGLLLTRLPLGIATAAAGPVVASLIGDFFTGGERGRIYSYILTGELAGAGIGFAFTGDVAALSWRAAFVILGLMAFPLAWAVFKLPEPRRGGAGVLPPESKSPQAHQSAQPQETPEPPQSPRTPQATDAQQLAIERGLAPDPDLVSRGSRKRMGMISATRYVLAVRTNVFLIISGACGYFFLAGVQTFGVEFVRGQYHVGAALANLLMLVVGGGAALGVITAGPISDSLLRRGFLRGRLMIAAVAASLTVLLFIPTLITSSIVTALPYVTFAALALSAQNPPIDAARLDIMPATLWGRAEGIRTFLRTTAQALAPLLFGLFSDHLFGGGSSGLRWTFVIMLIPLAASAVFLFRTMGTYPGDVATAGAILDLRPEAQ